VAVGGDNLIYVFESQNVQQYNPGTDSWMKVGAVPFVLHRESCLTLPWNNYQESFGLFKGSTGLGRI
jgi:hypothetical protein